MRLFVNLLLLLTISQSIGRLQSHLPYEVRWLGTSLDAVEATRDKNVIHCYPGTAKTIEKIWRTTEVHIFIKNDAFKLHVGDSPHMVQSQYMSFNLINFDQAQRTLSLDPFNRTCLMVRTDDSYGVQVVITGMDSWRVVHMLAGMVIVLFSRTLSRDPEVFYLCASFSGIFLLLILFLLLITQLYIFQMGISIIGGSTMVAFFFRSLWIIEMFIKYLIYCMGVTNFLAFLLAYRIGPPENPRAKDLMVWITKGIGVVIIHSSSWHEEVSATIAVLSIVVGYLLQLAVKNRRLVCFVTYIFPIILSTVLYAVVVYVVCSYVPFAYIFIN